MRGFHPEIHCMKNTIDHFSTLLEHNNISLPQGVEMSDDGEHSEEYESCHALKAGFTQSKPYFIDSGASNHIVSSRESFTTLDLPGEPNIHMGDYSQI